MMRVHLKSDDRMYFTIKTLHTILQNIIKTPDEVRF